MSLFPGSLASFLGFTSGHTLSADQHAAQHNSEQAEIIAAQTKIGTGASTPASGLLLRGNGAGTSAWGQANLISDITGVLPQANGGTGTTLATGTGKAVYDTLPTISGAQLTSSPTLSTPTITDFTNANHTHANAANGGQIGTSGISSNAITYPKLGAGATRLGLNRNAGGTLGVSYADYATVTATSNGGEVECEIGLVLGNGNSGANRTFDVRVLCDGVAITPAALTGIFSLFQSGTTTNQSFNFNFSSTPAAGSHTWKLQLEASAGASIVLADNYIKVAEVI